MISMCHYPFRSFYCLMKVKVSTATATDYLHNFLKYIRNILFVLSIIRKM